MVISAVRLLEKRLVLIVGLCKEALLMFIQTR